MEDEEDFASPVDVIPGYETDIRAVGTNRRAASPDDGVDWTEVHELSTGEAQSLTEEVRS